MAFKVESILDQTTIVVSPRWSWNGYAGNLVKIEGFGTLGSETGDYTVHKLRQLLINKNVELKNPTEPFTNSTGTYISVSVYLNGVNILVYFPELKVYA